jgi:hypothetical protein
MKKTVLRNMGGGDLLMFFERFYHQRLPAGRVRRILAIWYHVWLQGSHAIRLRARLAIRKRIGARSSNYVCPRIMKQSTGS